MQDESKDREFYQILVKTLTGRTDAEILSFVADAPNIISDETVAQFPELIERFPILAEAKKIRKANLN